MVDVDDQQLIRQKPDLLHGDGDIFRSSTSPQGLARHGARAGARGRRPARLAMRHGFAAAFFKFMGAPSGRIND